MKEPLHTIEITMQSSDVNKLLGTPVCTIELYEKYLIMRSIYKYMAEDELLGMEKEYSVDETIMLPKAYNFTPVVDLVENDKWKFIIEPSLKVTTPIFHTRKNAMDVFNKIVEWKMK